MIRAAVLDTVGAPISFESITLLPPRTGEVRVRVRAVGVCHSDLSVQRGVIPYQTPCVLGHECAGEIAEVGPETEGWAVGDRVVIQWVPMCRSCRACLRGEPHLCSAYLRVMGRMDDGTTRFRRGEQELVHGINVGGYAEEVVVRTTAISRLPDDVPFEVGAIIGCGFLTGWGSVVNVGEMRPGEHVVVFGAGGVGLSAAMAARAEGAASVLVVDPLADRRALAVAAFEGDLETCAPEDAEATAKRLSGERPDLVVDAVGRAAVQQAGLALVRPGGRLVIAGVNPGETIEFPGFAFGLQAKQVRGSWFGACDPARDLPRVIEAWRDRRLPIERLITATRPLSEIAEALAALEAGEGLRTVLIPTPADA